MEKWMGEGIDSSLNLYDIRTNLSSGTENAEGLRHHKCNATLQTSMHKVAWGEGTTWLNPPKPFF
jgi:hypothetical protein